MADKTETIDLTPNYGNVFKNFMRDARNSVSGLVKIGKVDRYRGGLHNRKISVELMIESGAEDFRAMDAFITPFTIALQYVHDTASLEELREFMSETLTRVAAERDLRNEYMDHVADLVEEDKVPLPFRDWFKRRETE